MESQPQNPEETQQATQIQPAEQPEVTAPQIPSYIETPPQPPQPPAPENHFPSPNTNQSHTRPHKRALTVAIIILLVSSSLVSAASIYSVYTLNQQVLSLQSEITTLAAQVHSSSNSGTTTASYTGSSSLSTLYNQVEDSVVTIECKIVEYYYMPFSREKQSATSTVQGSGFVTQYNGQYVIVTNNHVIADASSITVNFADGNTYTATVLGTDASTDLALLSCNAPTSEYHPLEIISSSSVSVGDAVIAIGSPYGLSGTMTTGIISALDRTITATDDSTGTESEITGLIQTSAPINSGNSGGPLMTYDGKVIGITTAIVSNSDGLGFAVPSNTILDFIKETLS